MRWEADLIVHLDVDVAATISFSEWIEVSLNCDYCRRFDRTVTFRAGEEYAKCSPGSARCNGANPQEEHPPFPGRLVSVTTTRDEETGSTKVTYKIVYKTESFEDTRYATRAWKGHPTWARIYFDLGCPECNATTSKSVQTNLGRPFAYNCPCGYEFCVERKEMPIICYNDPDSNEWKQVPARFPPDKCCTS